MRTLFCRSGNKTPIADNIINLFPTHTTYVEPFVGSGAVYFHKEPSKVEVLNDLDKDLMKGYRLVKTVSSDPSRYKDMHDLKQIQAFYDKTPITKEDKLTHAIVKMCGGFGGKPANKTVYKPANPYNKTQNIQEYKQRMKHTKLLSQDYTTIVKNYDSKDTLFYLDPPYEGSEGFYKHESMNYEDLNDILTNIKGKFILSINDSANIRTIFKKFNMKKVVVKAKKSQEIGTHDRRELVITNF